MQHLKTIFKGYHNKKKTFSKKIAFATADILGGGSFNIINLFIQIVYIQEVMTIMVY